VEPCFESEAGCRLESDPMPGEKVVDSEQ
jgi:hypothetical protein